MTAPALAHQTAYGRMYSRSLSEPPSVPSITSVISQAPHALDGWFGYMSANALGRDPRLPEALGDQAKLRACIREAANAATVYRDEAAARGDRVHTYCEQVSLRALGQPNRLEECRLELAQNGEEAFAARFDEWWDLYQVEPLAPEITVWNSEVGYAGTLDLVAKVAGRTCLIDYKTKGTDRYGKVKNMDAKVVMQLTAGLKAVESLVDAEAGTWEPWAHGDAPILLGVAIGETEVRPMRANPKVLANHWYKFCALRRAWEASRNASEAGDPLLPIAPPPSEDTTPGGTTGAQAN
ncbi:cytochrome [Arthrobacter roseus]|uniref:cytochrome n=1 Tax=Arthrobacter roseus TaxID=136274 RepID=UPI001964C609|nr:cytochrome [Arthrobacter roseus]